MLSEQQLPYDSRTLSPLPRVLQHGLTAVSFFGFLSFISSTTLFIFLTYRLVSWRLKGQAQWGYNQFVLLIYNLVLADIQQSLAFLLAARWLCENRINVGTSTCWAEGWFVSTGDLASGVWILTIAVHTFFAVIKGYKLSYSTFCAVIIGLWIFIYFMAIVGAASHPDDFYVRAGAWCWINSKYSDERLWLHYFWIFIAMFGTIVIYALIYFILHQRLRSSTVNSSSTLVPFNSHASNPPTTARAARYMVIYPFVYVICTLPLATGRMAAMTGKNIPYAYYCLAGAMITSCGWLDVLLYACTRRVLIFAESPPPVDDLGLDTFGITTANRTFWGTTTSIEGGVLRDRSRGDSGSRQVNSRQGSMDDLFGAAVPGKVNTKTTIQVNSQPMEEEIRLSDMRAAKLTVGNDSKENLSWADDKSGKSSR